ncbi:uncharacterized protein BO72DRAFT_384745 [Aspergillus fijiensis CBS 313.89]|uniref:Aromatic prenyltransferase n=1 Tax=Aspergillus fijiensis CBS 313.89 TaxID=1448319 RepID=A0A8G1VVF9_9EURO|nr:uncharacterized protein BO72DRAFT_384745 [Aspergillus fijiensis CBS 313.89]RAK74445.1 hypothetical protein BO72DRAFT_384745 [Aspergillus fijiensis CBS 313.89]
MPKQDEFDAARFLEDVERTCAIIHAPYSESHTRASLEAFATSFQRGAVLWRTTNRPGDALNYRFYERRVTDTVAAAIKAGLLAADHPLGALITAWSRLYDGTPEQSCDFDAQRGLAKAWVYLGGMRPIDDILAVEPVPESIRRHGPVFHSLGLEWVRHVAADYTSHTVNIYFRAPGPLKLEQADRYVQLAHPAGALEPDEVEQMRLSMNPQGFTFAVTMDYGTGDIKRVAFYALKLELARCLHIDPRLDRFFTGTPSYDEETMNAIAWSFGNHGSRYIKAERSYCGQLVPLLRDWNSAMTS